MKPDYSKDWTETVEIEEGIPIPEKNYSDTPSTRLAAKFKIGQSAFFTNENDAQNLWGALNRAWGGVSAVKKISWKGDLKGWRVWRIKMKKRNEE